MLKFAIAILEKFDFAYSIIIIIKLLSVFNLQSQLLAFFLFLRDQALQQQSLLLVKNACNLSCKDLKL